MLLGGLGESAVGGGRGPYEPEISGPAGTLLELVTASLSKDPAQRPSADDLVARLTSPTALPSPTARPLSAGPPVSARPPALGLRRTTILASAGVPAAALLVAGGLLINGGGRPVGSPPSRA
ncbi:hypothetical protein ACWEPL_58095 [Nonomuraea sp. NPDC004186]